jgi:MFS family permease
MVGLDVLVVTTALTTIRRQLGASLSELDWIVSAYTLSFAVLLMTAAALGDRYGRRRLLIAGLGLFTVASAACALVPGIGWLVAARAVQGAGSAMILPHAVSLLSAAYPPQRRARALGIFSGVLARPGRSAVLARSGGRQAARADVICWAPRSFLRY